MQIHTMYSIPLKTPTHCYTLLLHIPSHSGFSPGLTCQLLVCLLQAFWSTPWGKATGSSWMSWTSPPLTSWRLSTDSLMTTGSSSWPRHRKSSRPTQDSCCLLPKIPLASTVVERYTIHLIWEGSVWWHGYSVVTFTFTLVKHTQGICLSILVHKNKYSK